MDHQLLLLFASYWKQPSLLRPHTFVPFLGLYIFLVHVVDYSWYSDTSNSLLVLFRILSGFEIMHLSVTLCMYILSFLFNHHRVFLATLYILQYIYAFFWSSSNNTLVHLLFYLIAIFPHCD
jgi:hypothetical protein